MTREEKDETIGFDVHNLGYFQHVILQGLKGKKPDWQYWVEKLYYLTWFQQCV